MAVPTTQPGFLELLRKSRLVTDAQLAEVIPDEDDRRDPKAVADGLVKAGLLTRYQVQMLTAGKHRGFFLGPYKILRPIGQGGMGAVFLAEHTSLNRQVAVKVLPPDKAKDKLTLERFNREARAAAALDHPNIVRLHDISQGSGVHFLVMEYVEGTDLQSLMGQTGPLHYAQAAQYVAQAASGLQHAHEKGFIHRDIKPANLMLLKAGGVVKILDMGLARSLSNPTDHLTANLAEGDIAGTIDYLSPEQALNMPLDERSDIYSLGATFYSLVTGHPPFKGTTAQKLMQHQLKEPPSVSLKLSGRVPQALSDVVAKMMAKKPSERFQTAAEVIDALGPWLPVPTTGNIVTDPIRPGGSGQTTPIRRSARLSLSATGQPAGKRSAVLIGVAVGGGLLLVGGLVAAIAFALGGKPAEPTARPTAVTPAGDHPLQSTPAFKVPYTRIDFTGFSPTSVRVGGAGKSGEVLKSIGGQPLPTAVLINHFDGEALGEYTIADVNGATAIGLRQLNRRNGVQVHFLTDGSLGRLPEGTRATIRLTYLFDGTGEGNTSYELAGEPFTKYATTKLPPTGGKWKTVDVPFTRPVGGSGYEVIVNHGNVPYAEGTIYVKSVELLSADAAAVVSGAVYSFDAGKVTAFRRTGQTMEQNGYNELAGGAPGWSTEVYDKAGKGDFAAQREGEGGAIGVAATGERNCAQLAFRTHELPTDPLTDGKRYTVTIEYRTDRNLDGYASVQTMDEWKTIGGATLTDTQGEWRTANYSFVKPVGQKVQFTVGPKTPTGGFVWLRRVYLTGEDADGAGAGPPAGGKSVYALDLGKQKAFSRRGRSEGTGDPIEDVRQVVAQSSGGDPPAGWRAATWDLAAEMEFFGEDKDGRPALGLRSVKLGDRSPAAFTGMLFTPAVRLSGTTAAVRFTYRTQTSSANAAQLKFKPTVPEPRKAWEVPGAEALPGTGGKWVTRELTVDLKGASGGFFEFHPFSFEASDVFHLAAFEVLDPAVKGEPAKGGGPVAADFSALKAGAYPLDAAVRTGPDLGGWAANQFAADSTGELTVADDDGARALALVNATGTPSAQVYQTAPAGTLAAGRAYLLKFEYKAADGTSGNLEVREKEVGNWKDCPLKYKLDPTADRWEKRTFELEVPRDYPAVFVIQNLTGRSGNRLSVRNLEIVPVGDK